MADRPVKSALRLSRRTRLLAVAACLLLASPAPAGPPEWKILDQPEYSLRYPTTLKLVLPTQGICDGICSPVGPINLTGQEGTMSFVIQRNINPGRLSVRHWYESLARRPLNPERETSVVVAGREAVRRLPIAPGERLRVSGGKVISREPGLLPDDSIYVPLNPSDVLTVSIRPRDSAGAAVFEHVLQSLRIGG